MDVFTPRFNTLPDILEYAREEYADRPLFGTKRAGNWEWMTYAEFGAAADAARAGFAGVGVAKGDRVAIISDNREEWAVAAYGAYGLGAAVVPMYEAQKDENWHFILHDCGAKVAVVANENIRDRIAAFIDDLPTLETIVVLDGDGDGGSVSLADLLVRGQANPIGLTPLDTKDVAGFIYTSGTTGNPKGVILSQENFASNVSAVTDVFPIDPEDRTLSFLPWAHSFGQTVELHTIISQGASTAFAESVSAIMDNLPEVQPTMLVSVPRVFNGIYDGLNKKMEKEGGITKVMFDAAISNAARKRELDAQGKASKFVDIKHSVLDSLVFSKVRAAFGGHLKYAISGGAAISEDVANFIDSLGVTVYEGYGLSETSPIVTANYPGTRKIGSVGKPIPGVRVEIDREGRDDEDGDDGEIVVYGHNVMQGYYNLPEENEKAFTPDGGFRTGDLGRIDDEGFLVITGRVKEQYKLENGKYVVPTPLEEQLQLSPFISNAMVFGDNKPYNVGLVVLDEAAIAEWAAAKGIDASDPAALAGDDQVRELIRGEIAGQLAHAKGYERVKNFAVLDEDFTVDNGMLTPTLKLKRRVVLDRYADTIDELYE